LRAELSLLTTGTFEARGLGWLQPIQIVDSLSIGPLQPAVAPWLFERPIFRFIFRSTSRAAPNHRTRLVLLSFAGLDVHLGN